MAEGFFSPSQVSVPNVGTDELVGAMVRILPKTKLILDIAATPEAASELARNESLEDGTECWYRYFIPEDLSRVDDPEFAMGMVRHEFCRLVKAQADFPASTWLDGGGTGFCFESRGLVLTNFHLVTGEVAYHKREHGICNVEVLCKGLRAEIARRAPDGTWSWSPAERIWLVSHPSRERAFWEDATGLLHPREDVAVLRIEPAPSHFLTLSDRPVQIGELLWMAGFPIRSARSMESRAALGYADADGTLRISSGNVIRVEAPAYFTADIDGSMGNSGSPAIDRQGRVVGLFSRASGNGPKNAFEYGHMERVFVASGFAARSLGIRIRTP